MEFMSDKPDMQCGFCVEDNPKHLFAGWKGQFICDACVELLATLLADQSPDARERMLGALKTD
jgi:hypothetical protein